MSDINTTNPEELRPPGVRGLGCVIWHRFDFSKFDVRLLLFHFFWYSTYVDYLMFSHLNPIPNPTPGPTTTLTIGAPACNPNYRGSRVHPNYRGSCTQP